MNLSTKSKFSSDDDVSVPLNLSVKKAAVSASSSASAASSAHEASKLLSSKLIVNNNLVAPSRQVLSHPLLNQQSNSSSPLIPPQQQQQQPKKRGRKPKALLNNEPAQFLNFPDLASVANSFLAQSPLGPGGTHTSTPTNSNSTSDAKPRKRGRPPTLSPPHNSMQPIAAHASNHGSKANSSGAFPASYPFNLFNTPDIMSSWPGLNALTAAAAAAAAAAAGSPFSNSQNPFNLFKQLNQKDINNFNLNLMNTNLFNLKNLQSQDNDSFSTNNKTAKTERRPREDASAQSSSKSNANSSSSGTSKAFAHKPQPNEKQLRIPLHHGWKRFTYISGFSKLDSAIEGSVQYVAPCGKKIKTFPDLIKYLTKNAITSMARDNFSFDPNVVVGQFIQNIPGYGSEVLLSESQMKVQLEDLKLRNFGMAPSTSNQVHSNNSLPEKKRRVRDSGGTRNVYDSIKNFKSSTHKNMFEGSKNDFEPSITITLQNAQSSRGSKRKSMEQSKAELLRAEKMMKKQEEERQIREMKEKQEEERKMKEAQERQLELQKQEELKLLAEIERERANQHQMFIHALTELQTAEQREIKREKMAQEKNALQERKLIKKSLELELMKEMKKPIEDMMLKDLKDLPTFNRIPGLKLTGKAFADSLMVFEFLYNFGETIGFDTDSLPNLNTLMMALLNLDPEAEEELVSIVVHLVVCAIEDPGMPANITTTLGQKLKDANVTAHNLTEILRLYFFAFSSVVNEEDRERRVECRLYDQLNTGIPFIAMNATAKLDILGFLCNELLCNQAIVKQIDENIESVTSFKKDKWLLENDIRKLKLVKMKRERITELENAKKELAEAEETADSDTEETNPTVTAPALVVQEFEDDVSMTNEEIDKKVDRLNKQCNNMNNKLNRALNSYRVFPLGQDRFRRTYWLLPNCGGVFVEAMESGEPEQLERNVITEEEESKLNTVKVKEEDEEVDDFIKKEIDDGAPYANGKMEQKDEDDAKSETSTNDMQIDTKEEDAEGIRQSNDNFVEKESDSNEESMEVKVEAATTTEAETEVEPGENKEAENGDDAKLAEDVEQSEELKEPKNESEVEDTKWFDLLPTDCEREVKGEDEAQCAVKLEDDDAKEPEEEEEEEEAIELIVANKESELYRQLEAGLKTFLDEPTMNSLFGFVDQNEDAAILKEALLRIVSAFPTSATVTQFPLSDVSELETVVCLNLQKRIQAWKSLHHGVPLKIDREFQLGWWRITDPTQLKSLVELFHSNAQRERNLLKHMEKHLVHAMQSCKVSTANLEVNDFDRELSECREHGAPTQNKCPHKECFERGYCVEVSIIKDIQVLELIEAFEEKILASSMQVRNWKPSTKLSSIDFKLKMPSFTSVNSWSKNGKSSKSGSKKKQKATEIVENDHAENGIFSNENTNNSDSCLSNGNGDETAEDDDILTVERDKLLEVELSIERRYLKPPLGFKNSNMLANQPTSSELTNGDESAEYPLEENAPAGLLRWRDAVNSANCSSQVAMCLHFLENSIAWDKSIMRASCQFCGSGENEAHLLLCDLCDKGYHMYCFKPKMESVPAGDWYCFDCQNKNTIDKVCIVCGKKGKLLNCDTCAKVFHPNCIEPPMTKQIKGRWVCHLCQRKNKRFSGSAKSTSKKSISNSNTTAAATEERIADSPSSTPNHKETKRISNGNGKDKVEKPSKKERKGKQQPKEDKEKEEEKNRKDSFDEAVSEVSHEIELCRQLVKDMETHESCWPFLEPVNTKQFPTYKKIIKRPMDLTIIKCKFASNSYKTKADFAADIRLMFDNCVTFNEDESPVGQAGHNLRAFFETRWDELFSEIGN